MPVIQAQCLRGSLTITCLSAMTGQCHAVFRYAYASTRIAPPLALPAMGGPGRRTLMPGLSAQSVIHFAIGRRQVTMTDCNEQSVIS